MANDNPVLEPDVVDDMPTALALRHPGVPTTIDQLAARRGEAIEIIEARIQILETARLRAIRMTHPEDWVLFKTKDDRVTGYLSDSGCERVRPIMSISIFQVEEPKRVVSSDGNSFAYIVRGRGRSGLTLDVLDAVDGVRESTEDFCKDLKGVKQDIRVQQAARANLDGKIVRELGGLSSVPKEELERAWTGTEKKVEHCRKGRGFGSQDERLGGTKAGEPDVEPPTCKHCGAKMVHRRGDRGNFYGCPQYQTHADKKFTVDAEKWIAEQKSKAPTAAASQPAPAAVPAPTTSKPATTSSKAPQPQPIHADDIFGRQPGEDG